MGVCWPLGFFCRTVIAFMFFLCFLVCLFLEGGSTMVATPNLLVQRRLMTGTENFKHLDVGSRDFNVGKKKKKNGSHLVYVSKRRVPNGADPIHNRRAGKTGRPAGRS